MKRRQLLGICGTGALFGLAGCLATGVNAVTRTRARAAFAMPPVGEWRDRIDRPDGGSLRANNHNTTRSNRTKLSAGPTGDLDIEWTGTVSRLRSDGEHRSGTPLYEGSGTTGTNPLYTSRAEQEQAYGYLAGESVIGETFVLSVPSFDVPGVDDPGEGIEPTDVLPTGSGLLGSSDDDLLGSSLGDASILRGMSGATLLSENETTTTKSSDGPSKVYHSLARSSDDAGPFVVQWKSDTTARSDDGEVDSVSQPVVARAMATLESGVSLPVLVYARRLRHAGDWMFVAGWILDTGALYADATTLLVDAGANQIVQIDTSDALGSSVPESVVESLPDRGRMGSLAFDGPATDDLLPFLPADLRAGDGATALADAARRSSGVGRYPRTSPEVEIPAARVARMTDTVDVIRTYLDGCGTDVCGTLREHADDRHGLLREATASLDAGDHGAVRRSLLKVRDIVEGDIQRLGAAEDGDDEALADVAGLEAALLRESALALDSPDGAGNGKRLELAVEKMDGGVAGDDDGDGVWDPIDESAVDGEVSTERLRVDGDVVVDAHTFALTEGKKGMNAINVKVPRSDDTDGGFTWGQVNGPLAWSVFGGGGAGGRVVVTALADPETGEATSTADLVEQIAPRSDVSRTHARRALDTFVDAAARLHAGIEKDGIKRGMVVAEPGIVGDWTPRRGEDVAIPAFDNGDGYTESETLDAVVVTLDGTLVHLASSCPDCEYADSWLAGPSAAPSLPETIRVLHVDDEPGLADVSANLLEARSDRLSVTPVTSAAEGLDHLRENRVDCVISDFIMPSMNGLEFLEAVRGDHPDLPFILFTVRGEEEVWSEARAAGATDHPEKGTVHLEKGRVSDQYAALADRIERSVASVTS